MCGNSANDVYSVPWPSEFSNFLDVMKVFLVRLGLLRLALFSPTLVQVGVLVFTGHDDATVTYRWT